MALSQLSLEGKDRIQVAIDRLRQFEPPAGYQLAFSGGKDSIVIYDLAQRSAVRFHPFFTWTGIDPPQVYYFVKQHYPQVEIRKPEKTMWQLIEEHHILPTRQIRFCCQHLKEKTNSGYVITGVRWSESIGRRKRRFVEAHKNWPGTIFLNAIVDWTNAEVWEYIRRFQLPYCKLYDEGFRRLGCILCPLASASAIALEMERFPKHVLMWKHACDRLVASSVNSPFRTGEELFNWWISRKASKVSLQQCPMFN
jgi:phosphoadenosine phosphosulfate reductase